MSIDQLAIELGSFRAGITEQLSGVRKDLRDVKVAVMGEDGEHGLRGRVASLETCAKVESATTAGLSKGAKVGLIFGLLFAGAGAQDLILSIIKALGG